MSKERADPASLLPLRPLILAILLVLKGGDRHGYGIMQWVNENAGLGTILGPGTLYRTLKEMRELGIVAHAESPGASGGDERRSYYTLTSFGRDVLVAEAERLGRLLRGAEMVELLSKPGSR